MLITSYSSKRANAGYYSRWDPSDLSGRKGLTGPGRHGLPGTSENKYILRVLALGGYSHGVALDSGRDWDLPYQNILLTFDGRVADASLGVGDEAAGHTIKVNGVAQTTTYRSGSGTNQWIVRIPVLLKSTDALTYSYSASEGNTVEVVSSQELPNVTDKPVFNVLTKRIRFMLRQADDNLVAEESIKLVIHKHSGGDVSDPLWMKPIYRAVIMTDDAGMVDFAYPEAEISGTTVYVALFRPNTSPTESLIWTDTIK